MEKQLLSVILEKIKTKTFKAFGRFIQGLNGRYITAEDVGTTEADMDLIHLEKQTTNRGFQQRMVVNPSPITAFGVYKGMKAAKEAFGNSLFLRR